MGLGRWNFSNGNEINNSPAGVLIASFDHQAGTSAPSFDHPVRIARGF
jgi:hypothetical protein